MNTIMLSNCDSPGHKNVICFSLEFFIWMKKKPIYAKPNLIFIICD